MKTKIKILTMLLAGASFAQGMFNGELNQEDKNQKNPSNKEIAKYTKKEGNFDFYLLGVGFPKEILIEIFSFVNYPDTPKLKLVCKKICKIITCPRNRSINLGFIITKSKLDAKIVKKSDQNLVLPDYLMNKKNFGPKGPKYDKPQFKDDDNKLYKVELEKLSEFVFKYLKLKPTAIITDDFGCAKFFEKAIKNISTEVREYTSKDEETISFISMCNYFYNNNIMNIGAYFIEFGDQQQELKYIETLLEEASNRLKGVLKKELKD